MIVDLLNTKVKKKVSFILGAASLVLLMQVQPVSGMEYKGETSVSNDEDYSGSLDLPKIKTRLLLDMAGKEIPVADDTIESLQRAIDKYDADRKAMPTRITQMGQFYDVVKLEVLRADLSDGKGGFDVDKKILLKRR